MKERVSYIIGALIVYFIGGLLVSYFGNSSINWMFVVGWTVSMTIADFFIIRTLRYRLTKNRKTPNYER